jgi:hypothetical protein
MPFSGPPLSRSAWRALAIGFAIAAVMQLFPMTAFLFHPLMTIIHEIGHAAAAWSFGYPAVPGFDFGEGGGATATFDRSVPVTIGVYCLVGWAIWRTRRHLPTVGVILGLTAIHAWLNATPRHEAWMIIMGHGMEPVFAAVFLYRAMTGTTLLQADERPAYAMIGFLMMFDRLSFFYKLTSDADFLAWYNEGKSYADNDLVRVGWTFWHTTVQHLAQVFLVIWLCVPLIARLFYRLEGPISLWLSRFTTDSE